MLRRRSRGACPPGHLQLDLVLGPEALPEDGVGELYDPVGGEAVESAVQEWRSV